MRPRPDAPDPGLPIWATRTVEAFSRPGDRVIVRSLGGYPSLPGEVAALIGAATAAGRMALALLPTPATAARTRALLPAAAAEPAAETVAIGVTAATTTVGTAGMATAGMATAGMATTGAATTGVATPGGATTARVATPAAAAAAGSAGRSVVGVGRRRPARETGAALAVVLAGPVTPGARRPRRPIPARALAAWAAGLRPGGMLVVLCPPAVGRRRWGPPPAGVVATAHDIGLAYIAHIVLVHAPVRDGRLQRPECVRRPHAPFWAVHTDLFALRAADNPFEHTRPIPVDPSRTRHPQTDPAPAGPAGEPEVAV